MSFAVIKTGGKQYKVKAGEILKVELLENAKAGTKLEFKEILAYGDNKSIEISQFWTEQSRADLIKNSKIKLYLFLKKEEEKIQEEKMVIDKIFYDQDKQNNFHKWEVLSEAENK